MHSVWCPEPSYNNTVFWKTRIRQKKKSEEEMSSFHSCRKVALDATKCRVNCRWLLYAAVSRLVSNFVWKSGIKTMISCDLIILLFQATNLASNTWNSYFQEIQLTQTLSSCKHRIKINLLELAFEQKYLLVDYNVLGLILFHFGMNFNDSHFCFIWCFNWHNFLFSTLFCFVVC